MRSSVLASVGCALVVCARLAGAVCAPVSSPDVLCAPGADPCIVDGKDCPVVPGTTLDFGTRAVVLQHGTRLDVGTGGMTVLAGSLALQPGTGLIGHGGAITVHTTGDMSVLRSGTTRARIDVADPVSADRIEIVAGGMVQVDGFLDARGTNSDGSGGSIDVIADDVVVTGDVLVGGGQLGIGGVVSFDATGIITVSGTIDGTGGTGAPLDLAADGAIMTSGRIDIRATAAGGDGGIMTVLSTGASITLGGKIFMQGDTGTDQDGGASGGELNVFSPATLTLSADFEVTGAAPDGQGGEVFFSSVLDTVQTGLMQVQGRGMESDGGTVEFDVHRGLTLGSIDVHGGESLEESGGDVQATVWCDITVPSNATLTALGGPSLTGDHGEVVLQSGGRITVVGTVKSAARNLFEYRTLVPLTSGGTFRPDPEVQENLTLTPCGGRRAPPGCGNDKPDAGEECDDGNTTPCDGCSPTCKLETCGNMQVDCGEACDDGNTTSGDGCHGDCSRVEFVCGDTIVDGPLEQCDDGNDTACDPTHCSSSCRFKVCGNGTVDCNEECDPPDAATGCTAQCISIPPGCGNDNLAETEECDDGNTTDGDGCSHQCRKEICGNGKVDPGEDCDDSNTNCRDGCSPTCKNEVCGNGVLDCGEECDDGAQNGAPGGTCLACRPAAFCTTGSSDPCIPCASTTNCDPLGACGPAACDAGVCTPVNPPSCDDGDICTGTETCDAAIGCKAGVTLDCDDADVCTTDDCDPQAGCVHTPLAGLEFPLCRVGTAREILKGAAAADVKPRLRGKLLRMLGAAEGKLVVAKTNPHKTKKAIGGANKQIRRVVAVVTKQRGTKIAPEVAANVLAALGAFPVVTP